MGWGFPVAILVIFFVFVLPTYIVVTILKTKYFKKIPVSENAPFIELDKSRVCHTGYARGIVSKITPCKNGCTRVEYYPTDCKQGDNAIIPSMKTIIIKDENLKPISEGDLSPNRTIIKTISALLSDSPEKMRDSKEAKDESEEGQKALLEVWDKIMLNKTIDNATSQMVEHGMVTLDKMAIKKRDERIQAEKRAIEEKK